MRRELGRGVMATAYFAQDLQLHRSVALMIAQCGLVTSRPAAHRPSAVAAPILYRYPLVFDVTHVFHDGNKRTALAALDLMLESNGHTLQAGEAELAQTMDDLAADRLSFEDFVSWIRAKMQPPPSSGSISPAL